MKKRFFRLRLGEQFDSGDGWDLLKCGALRARAAHMRCAIWFFMWPWEYAITITPNPNCTAENCNCKEFDQPTKPTVAAEKLRERKEK